MLAFVGVAEMFRAAAILVELVALTGAIRRVPDEYSDVRNHNAKRVAQNKHTAPGVLIVSLYSLGFEMVDAGGIEQLPGIENREVIDFKSRTKR